MENFLVSVALPLTLAFIMFTLGLGLRVADFLRVFQMPKAFFTGFVNQVVFLPIVGFCLALAFGLPPELLLGLTTTSSVVQLTCTELTAIPASAPLP